MNMHTIPTAAPEPGPAHAVYAPSSAHRWADEDGCSASAEAIARLGEQPEGEEAVEGTEAHFEIDRVLGPYGRLSATCEKIELHLPALLDELDPDHAAAEGLELVMSYVSQLPPGKLWVEQRVRLTDKIWGRCDVAHWHAESRVLTIVDYKNGHVGVDAERNAQLRIYAIGMIYTHNLPALQIRYVVVQPNDFRPVPRVKQWPEPVVDLHAWAQRVAAIPEGPLKFVAGEGCTYCPLFGRCEASRDVLTRLGVAMAYPPSEVPAAQVAIFSAMEKPIKDFFKGLDKAQTAAALQGRVAPGMKLVTTTKHRAWVDENAARAAILAKLGVEALDPPTPAQAKERGMSEAEIEAISIKPVGGPALAFENDRRKPWEQKSGAAMFKDVIGNAT